jgi:hypothetical protein
MKRVAHKLARLLVLVGIGTFIAAGLTIFTIPTRIYQ